MLRHERRLLIDCLGIGIALTLFVIAADATGMLGGLEDILYDLRAQLCQHFTPRPTDTLVHLDIDEAANETIGWPLPRASLARILAVRYSRVSKRTRALTPAAASASTMICPTADPGR